jgi:hypothetical protein
VSQHAPPSPQKVDYSIGHNTLVHVPANCHHMMTGTLGGMSTMRTETLKSLGGRSAVADLTAIQSLQFRPGFWAPPLRVSQHAPPPPQIDYSTGHNTFLHVPADRHHMMTGTLGGMSSMHTETLKSLGSCSAVAALRRNTVSPI